MEKKGQGALEYLLLIGGAVLVAVIVITLLLGITNTGAGQTGNTTAASLCTQSTAIDSGQVCATKSTGGARQVTIQGANGGRPYNCGGTYPSCTATAT